MRLNASIFPGGHRSFTAIVDSRLGFSYPLHSHEDFGEFMFLARGRMRHRVNGVDVELGAGDLVLVREDDEHAVACDDVLYFNTNIRSADLQRTADYLDEGDRLRRALAAPMPPMVRLPPGQRPALEDVLVRLQVHQGTPAGGRLLQQALIVCCQAVLPLAGDAVHRGPPEWLAQLMVDAATRLPVMSPAALARLAGVGPEHLSRTFRRHLGTTPAAWLNRQRLERAVVALVETNDPVTAIALDLGFGSPGYFARVFRATYDCTPTEYREQRRQR